MAGYGTDQGLTDWLAANGYTLPESAPTPAILRQRGSSYVDGVYEGRLPGYRTGGLDQERAWPRTGATFNRQPIPSDTIPNQWIEASYAAAYYEGLNPGGLLIIVTAAGAVKREKVGPIETEYFGGADSVLAAATPVFLSIEGLLGPFLVPEAVDGPFLWAIGGPPRC